MTLKNSFSERRKFSELSRAHKALWIFGAAVVFVWSALFARKKGRKKEGGTEE